jgi:hypothetical protein
MESRVRKVIMTRMGRKKRPQSASDSVGLREVKDEMMGMMV